MSVKKKAVALTLSLHIVMLVLLLGALPIGKKTPPRIFSSMPVSLVYMAEPQASVESDLEPQEEKAKITPTPPPIKMKPVAEKKNLVKLKPPMKKKKTKPKPTRKKTKEKKRKKTVDDLLKGVKGGGKKGQSSAVGLSLDARAQLVESVRQQIMGCWSVPQRLRDAKGVTVAILLKLDKTGKVLSAHVMRDKSTVRHRDFQLVADTALRAVHHPSCSPLVLPASSYEDWKETIMYFSTDDL